MRPFLMDGDRLEVAPIAVPPRIGDVVLLKAGPFGVAHRVVLRVGAKLLIKGDALPRSDGWVGLEEILGVVVGVRRRGRNVRLFRRAAVAPSLLAGVLGRAGLPRIWRKLRRR